MNPDVRRIRRRTGIGAFLLVAIVGILFGSIGMRMVTSDVTSRLGERQRELEDRVSIAEEALAAAVEVAIDDLASIAGPDLELLAAFRDRHAVVSHAFRWRHDEIEIPRRVREAVDGGGVWLVPEITPSLRATRDRIERWREEGKTRLCLDAIDQLLARDIAAPVRVEVVLLREVVTLEARVSDLELHSAAAGAERNLALAQDVGAATERFDAELAATIASADERLRWSVTARMRLAGVAENLGLHATRGAILVDAFALLSDEDAYFRQGQALRFFREEIERKLREQSLSPSDAERFAEMRSRLAQLDAEAAWFGLFASTVEPRVRLDASVSAVPGWTRIDLADGSLLAAHRGTADGCDGIVLDESRWRERFAESLPAGARLVAGPKPLDEDTSSNVLVAVAADPLDCRVRLDLTDEIGAYRMRRGWTIAAMFGAAWIGIALGAFATWRGLCRQAELAAERAQFVANVSHELKTPLTLIRMFADMLREGYTENEADRDRALEVIQREAGSLSFLIDNVLDASRMDSGRAEVRLERQSIEPLIEGIVAEQRPILESKGFRFSVSIAAGLPEVAVDRGELTRAIRNLIANAVKYSDETRELAIDVRSSGGGVCIDVADRGIGLPPGSEDRIFERYVRGDVGADREIAGTGLGLSIVAHVVEAHGGIVRAQARAGGGSRFVIELPAAADEG